MNKIHTLGYFKKRLKDNGFIVLDLFKNYSNKDNRKWSIIINPGQESIHCVCMLTNDFKDPVFEFSDNGVKIKQKHFLLVTSSMEVIIQKLLVDWKILNNNTNSPYYKNKNIEK